MTTCSCCRVAAGSGRAAAAAAQNTSTSTNAYIRVFLPEHVLNRAVEGVDEKRRRLAKSNVL